MVKHDLFEVVQKSYRNKEILRDLNTTFIALIPKKEGANSLYYFHLISLCNVIYKSIIKLISERLKPWLANLI